MPAQMLLDRPELLDKFDQIGLALSALFIAFLPLVLWRRHRQGRLDRRLGKRKLDALLQQALSRLLVQH